MKTFVRVAALILFAVFAAGAGVYATDPTAAPMKMLHADGSGTDSAGCNDCGSGDGNGNDAIDATCDLLCTLSFVVVADTETTLPVPSTAHRAGYGADRFVGRTGPPEPYPPRCIIVS